MAAPLYGACLRISPSVCATGRTRKVKQLHVCQRWQATKAAKPYYISTPIFYVNAAPHIGHLYTALLADAQARWQRLKQRQSFLYTGTDEHGSKIQKAAEARGLTPAVHCDKMSNSFKELYGLCNVQYADFVRTTEARHADAVKAMWDKLCSRGAIYKGYYAGWYSMADEAFYTDDQVAEGVDSYGNPTVVSKFSGQLVEQVKEENYMFKLTAFADDLEQWLNKNVIRPIHFRTQAYEWLKALRDVSVSRPCDRVSWGIPVPNDPEQTSHCCTIYWSWLLGRCHLLIYVWLDALVNYLTLAGYPASSCSGADSRWPFDCQVIGKDILKFHAIYWPAFLMAADLSPPTTILCHSHWLVDGVKMSKSRGNVVDPFALARRYTSEGLRYFLLREGVPHLDGNYSDEKCTDTLNSELCNTLGNLLNRTTSTAINSSQLYPPLNGASAGAMASHDDSGSDMLAQLAELPGIVDDHFSSFNFFKGIDAIMAQLRAANGFVERSRPWELQDQSQRAALDLVLHVAMECLRVCGILLQPITPTLSGTLLTRLGVHEFERSFEDATKISKRETPRRLSSAMSSPLYPRLKK